MQFIKSHRKAFLALSVVVLAAIILVVLEATNTTYLFHKKAVPSTIPVSSNSQKGTSKQDKKAASSNAKSSAGPQNTKVASVDSSSTAKLVQPYGTLVSNHMPGQNGSGMDEQSTCSTTPGATCYIQFTNTGNGKTTKLPAQTVGSDSSTSWAWSANTLTSGEWEVKAVASLNGQTLSVTDSIKLVVQ